MARRKAAAAGAAVFFGAMQLTYTSLRELGFSPVAAGALSGVPEAALKGHAYHTYALKSADGSVGFEFQHNVQGRRTYADGTVDAVKSWKEEIDTWAKNSDAPNLPVVLFANKSDLLQDTTSAFKTGATIKSSPSIY